MDKNTRIYYETAKRLKLPVTYLDSIRCLRIHLGKKNYYFMGTITPFNSGSSIFIAKNKHTLLSRLKNAGFPVPNHIVIDKSNHWPELLAQQIQNLTFPVVAKPRLNTHGGEGVLCNIKTLPHLRECLEKSFEKYSFMQIEEFHQGFKEYRVLILKNRVIGVVQRFSAHITGNGKHTIKELIATHNHTVDSKHDPIQVDTKCLLCLADQGLTLDDIVPQGQIIRLHYAVNSALGGTTASLGKKIPVENAKYLCQVARITGLDLLGLDILCEDIDRPFSKTRWLIIEANFGPSISIHEFAEGVKINVSKKILMQIIFRHPLAYIFHRLANCQQTLFFNIL